MECRSKSSRKVELIFEQKVKSALVKVIAYAAMPVVIPTVILWASYMYLTSGLDDE